jgi:hypothetical protein
MMLKVALAIAVAVGCFCGEAVINCGECGCHVHKQL